MRSLWRAAKRLKCNLFDEKLSQLTDYDLAFLDLLEYFDDYKTLENYRNSFTDDDFNEFVKRAQEGYDDLSVYDDSDWEEVKDNG